MPGMPGPQMGMPGAMMGTMPPGGMPETQPGAPGVPPQGKQAGGKKVRALEHVFLYDFKDKPYLLLVPLILHRSHVSIIEFCKNIKTIACMFFLHSS